MLEWCNATKIIDLQIMRKRLPDFERITCQGNKKRAQAEARALRNREERRSGQTLESLDSKQFLQVVVKNDVLIKQAYQGGRRRGGASGRR